MGTLRGPLQIFGGKHEVQILGSVFQTLKYVILHDAIVEMSIFIEDDDYIHYKLGWPVYFQGGHPLLLCQFSQPPVILISKITS